MYCENKKIPWVKTRKKHIKVVCVSSMTEIWTVCSTPLSVHTRLWALRADNMQSWQSYQLSHLTVCSNILMTVHWSLWALRARPSVTELTSYPTPLCVCRGRWASVHKCRLRSSGAEYAAKFCHKLRLGLYAHQEILHEVAALWHCRRCPRIVQLREVFETEHQYILIMELWVSYVTSSGWC